MKSIALLLLLLSETIGAQSIEVKKSIFGIQTGILGFYINNESKLSSDIALRSEIGLDSGIFLNNFYEGVGFYVTPVLTVEPRWNYNLKKRAAKSKIIADNNGNFLSLKTSFNPDWFVISNHQNLEIPNQIAFIPTWGLRRNLGQNFNYETGLGIGYRYIFGSNIENLENESEIAVNIHLRIGYKF